MLNYSAAQRLWASASGPESRTAWKSALSHYDAALAIRITQPRRDSTELVALDQWYRKTVGNAVSVRGFMILDELVDIVRWKLLRGKFRPNLLKFAQGNPPAFVETCSRDAVEKCTQGKLGEAMACLCKLKGIGPATASAVLSAICPDAPFMADEAVVAVLGSIKYNVKVYDRFANELKQRHAGVFGSGSAAKEDPDQTTDEDEEEDKASTELPQETGFSIADMSHALWAAAFVPFDKESEESSDIGNGSIAVDNDDVDDDDVSSKNKKKKKVDVLKEEEDEEVAPPAKRTRRKRA